MSTHSEWNQLRHKSHRIQLQSGYDLLHLRKHHFGFFLKCCFHFWQSISIILDSNSLFQSDSMLFKSLIPPFKARMYLNTAALCAQGLVTRLPTLQSQHQEAPSNPSLANSTVASCVDPVLYAEPILKTLMTLGYVSLTN